MITFKPNWIPPRTLPPREQPPEQREHEAALDAFYNSKAWKEVRALKRQLSPLCEQCKAIGIIKPMAVVHHRRPVREAPELALDIEGLESVCLAHHNRVHPEKGGKGL